VSLDDFDAVRLVEAWLFASAEPIPAQILSRWLGDGAEIRPILAKLQADYAGRGVNLVERDGAWAFRTAADLGDRMRIDRSQTRKLSRAALETLSIIAYHQPVSRAEIESIRGVATARGTLDVLIEANWIKPGPRRETPGRPGTWVTSQEFLDQFGLSRLADLPGAEELKKAGLIDKRPAIQASGEPEIEEEEIGMDDQTGSLF
jgi:segregation and condensation protein B